MYKTNNYFAKSWKNEIYHLIRYYNTVEAEAACSKTIELDFENIKVNLDLGANRVCINCKHIMAKSLLLIEDQEEDIDI